MICIRLTRLLTDTLKVLTLLFCISFASHTYAHNMGDDDTILVEESSNIFNCYKSAIKAFSKELLEVYVGDFFTSGANVRDDVIRNFSELASRTNYKVNLKQDRVELKLTLDF